MIKKMSTKQIVATSIIAISLLILVVAGLLIRLSATQTQAATSAVSAIDAADAPVKPTGHTDNFTLYVRQTQLKMADGTKIWAFGYTDDPRGGPKIPGPPIIVEQGDTVNVTLIDDRDPTKTTYNTDGDGHTIHLHGLDLPSAMDGDPMTATGGHSVLQGQRYTYHFVAQQAGTYWYHCHEGAPEHIQMGMYGALIIRPQGQPNMAYAGTPKFDKESTFVLSEMDSVMHATDFKGLYHGGDDPNWAQYHPNYFFINGKSWPDTAVDPNDSINAKVGQTVLVRLINSGSTVHSMHSHGFHFEVIGSDGRKLASPYYKDTLDIAPGERYDVIFKLNQAGRFMFHDHIEYTNTNNGVYAGGMLTMINVDNADGTNPVPMKQMMDAMKNGA
jgi:FtsP/CotA-like multicopper oxidase with cupredoxin domain